ncbi:AfsR/SARP family transcriptional regulator [Kutzneria kofuensis]|uniref:DNA-binding SARP family transcriptional activator/tetratricopeptide (TPR) repeat protein n=1 Tax=Kutzneria kofuensis TaxID=103725 RepID=A0A7W9NJ90_9PSEU|nr:BTAD domain-containing putative transcriptional regulator [Kutzneria kofuensis]MBB5895402.1 DNA-binding SARP family transcriptional activator/tetratricopeptide (TPR) repeat protein [Kutzneria kofuensis]
MAEHALAFTVLGPLRGWRGGQELTLGSPQQRAALAVLLLRGERPVDIDELILALWGENPPKAATGAVRTYVSRLRTLLEPEHRTAGGPSLLVSVGTAYVLRLPEGTVDVENVEQEVAAAQTARRAGDLAQAHDLLTQAAARWRGTPLAGLTGPYVDSQREHLIQRRLSVLEQRIELDLELGEWATAVADLTPLTAEHPLRENLRALQMRALYQSGRQAEALAVFVDTRKVLAEELGIDPDPRLTELHERILRSDPTLLPRPAQPAAAPVAAIPAQLPADTADFTGRSELVAAVVGRLTAPAGQAVPVCAVHGIGGAGKTALAVHVAHAVREHFSDGQLYVDLGGASDRPAEPHDVLGYFLRSLGVPENTVPEDEAARAALYRTTLARRKVLVLLDNARDAAQVTPLLPGYPTSAAILTSRVRLAAVPAMTVDLDAFRPDEAMRLLAGVVGEERIAAEPEAARDLVALCGHLPLAVRVIACRLLARPGARVEDSVRRLSDERRRLSQLRAGDLDVQACFRLGYDQLPPAQARAFRLLALPEAETVPLTAAAALLDLDEYDTEDELDRLVDAGLVQSPRVGRYRFHDLVRVFARDRGVEQDDTVAAMGRLLDFLLATVRNAYLVVRPGHRIADLLTPRSSSDIAFAGADEAHAWFDQDRDFVLSVLRQAIEQMPELVGLVADVLLGLDPLLERAYAWHEIVTLGRLVATRAERAGLPLAEAAARYMLGGGLWQLGGGAAAREHVDRAIELSTRHGSPHLLAEAMTVRALALDSDGDPAAAVELFRETLELQRTNGNRSAEANTLGNLTHSYVKVDRLIEAVNAGALGLTLYRELGDRMGETQILLQRGTALQASGRAEDAMACYVDALALSRELGIRYVEANTLIRIADARLRAGDAKAAATAADQATMLAKEIGFARAQARALATLGRALATLGQTDRAAACLHETRQILAEHGLAEGDEVAQLLVEMGRTAAG